jgi:hypothetical protein
MSWYASRSAATYICSVISEEQVFLYNKLLIIVLVSCRPTYRISIQFRVPWGTISFSQFLFW